MARAGARRSELAVWYGREVKAAEFFVQCLEHEGLDWMFGVPGEENLALLDALLGSQVRFLATRHEQGAAFMANVMGRLTGTARACLATLGPGATNLLTGVADANMDRAPLVAITGQASTERSHKESHQHVDLVSLFRPVVKWNVQVVRGSVVPEAVRKAFELAQAEKPGATHLDLPEDVADEEIPSHFEPLSRHHALPAEPVDAAVEQASALLSEARFPLVLAGNGVARGAAAEALRRFAEALGLPVAETFMGKGNLPAAHPLSLGAVGLQQADYASCGFDRADVVVCVGYDLVEWSPSRWNPERDKKIIHIDASPAEVDACYGVAVSVLGAIDVSLSRIASHARPRAASPKSGVGVLRESIQSAFEAEAADDGFPVKPQRLVRALRDALADDDILVSDVGAHKLWIARMLPCALPNTCIISNGFASMGIGLPGAIGAKLLHPEKRVIAACGDGGFLMNVQELETAVRAETPIVVVIFEDHGYGVIRWKQMREYGRPAFVEFGNPDFVRLAESFGCKGYRVEATAELASVLEDALKQRVPSVVAVPVDYDENLKLTERLGAWVCPI
jgi:acetolactate synthase I/II/III large subunit